MQIDEGGRSERLQADDFKCVVGVEGDDAHCLVFTTNGLNFFKLSKPFEGSSKRTRYGILCLTGGTSPTLNARDRTPKRL